MAVISVLVGCMRRSVRPGMIRVHDDFRCIHGWNGKHPRQSRWQPVLPRRWWHRVFAG